MRQLKIVHKITSRESIAIEKYLNEIGKIDLLTPEEEAELARKIKQGDQDALSKLTKGNLRFVVSVAKQYQNQGLSLADLINEGNIGLMKAAKRFDESRGFKFISYAVWWIRQSILQAIVEYSRIVRLPLNKVNSYNKVNQAHLSFVQEFEREPSIEELADLLGMTPKEVDIVMKGSSRHISIDAPMSEEDDSFSLLDMMISEDGLSPDLKLMEESVREEVAMGLSALSPREASILEGFFGLNGLMPLTLEELAQKYSLTRERTRQIRDRALGRLRKRYTRISFGMPRE